MVASLTSPNVGNLRVGKGIVSFMKTGFSEFRDLGAVPEFELSMEAETLDHFSARAGIRSKDFSVVLEQGGNVRFIMEEWTPFNASLFLLGDVDEAAVGGPEVEIFGSDSVEGKMRFVGTNEVGPKMTATFDSVKISPTGSINFIDEDDFGGMEVTAEILRSEETDSFGMVKWTNIGSES